MSKYQEALDRIKSQRVKVNSWEYRAFADKNSDLDTLKELVDRATPKKVTMQELGKYIIHSDGQCKCGEFLTRSDKYCHGCGQAILWEE